MDTIAAFIAENPIITTIYQVTRFVVIVLDIVFIVLTVHALRKLWHYRPKLVYDPRKWQKHVKPKKNKVDIKSPVVTSAWSKVEARLSDPSPDALRLAVVEADGIVDEVLKRMGLSGETFADRLGHLNAEKYSSVEHLWEAHRLRNNLVHTPDFEISAAKSEEALAAYQTFLKEVKAI